METQNNFQDNMFMEEEGINIRQQIEKYLYHWKWFALGLVCAATAAFLYLRYTPSAYSVSTTILIDNDSNSGISSELSAFTELGIGGSSEKNIENEMGILKSRSLMTRVVKKLDLNISYFKKGRVNDIEIYKKKLPFKASFLAKDSSFYKTELAFTIKILSDTSFQLSDEEAPVGVTYTYGESVQIPFAELILTPTQIDSTFYDTEFEVKIAPIQEVAKDYQKAVEVNLVYKYASILELTLENHIKLKAIDILDELVRQYNKDAIEHKSLIGNNTDAFINERLSLIEKDLKQVDKTAEVFKIDNNLTDIPLEASIVLQTNSKVEKEIIELNTQLKLINYVIGHMNSSRHNLIPENLGINSNEINASSNQYNKIVLERNRVAQSSGKNNPILLNLDSQLSQLRESITQGLINLKQSLNITLEQTRSQQRNIDNRISAAPTKEREYRDIQRQQQIIETLYLFLLEKREENAITLAVTVPNAKLIDAADGSDKPVSPNRKIVVALALLLGLFTPFILISISSFLDNSIHNQEDIEEVVNAPIIGNVPLTHEKNKIITRTDRGNVAEAFRMLRTNMNFVLNRENSNPKLIYVTSTIPGEGKTFITINLATALSMSDKKVLIIGADIRKPKVAQYLDMETTDKGLSMFLADPNTDIRTIIQPTQKGDFDIIQSGMVPPNPSELLINGRFDDVIAYGKEHYDYILVDTAPVNMVTDTLQIASKADLFIYVIRANYLDKRLLQIPEKLYSEKRIPNMACVLNSTDAKNGYGYGYGYGYGEDIEVPETSWIKRIFKKN